MNSFEYSKSSHRIPVRYTIFEPLVQAQTSKREKEYLRSVFEYDIKETL